ncbi:hypothetical protein LIOPPNJA_27650, partial [Robbsia andropogonis]|uniref:hypothetical protein n=1 Tax=Robbsia andropogonis TaxID=28092 RepID=UPI00209D92CE
VCIRRKIRQHKHVQVTTKDALGRRLHINGSNRTLLALSPCPIANRHRHAKTARRLVMTNEVGQPS